MEELRCGDGLVQASFGETCDPPLGAGCSTSCMADCTCFDAFTATREIPCDPDAGDDWRLSVTSGQHVLVRADTVDASTAADLVLTVACPDYTSARDDDFPCTFQPYPPPAPATRPSCPELSFRAPADGDCTFSVAVFRKEPGAADVCVNPALVRYGLVVHVNGANASVTLGPESGGSRDEERQ
jgi:hypothetical protein